MSFYRDFAAHYEQIFPFRPATLAFLRERLPEGRRVLDLGCGTAVLAMAAAAGTALVVDLDASITSMHDIQIEVDHPNRLTVPHRRGDHIDVGSDRPPSTVPDPRPPLPGRYDLDERMAGDDGLLSPATELGAGWGPQPDAVFVRTEAFHVECPVVAAVPLGESNANRLCTHGS